LGCVIGERVRERVREQQEISREFLRDLHVNILHGYPRVRSPYRKLSRVDFANVREQGGGMARNRDGWPDWGRLIDEAIESAGLSQNEAARRAAMTGTHWRNIVKGKVGEMGSDRGLKTLARMAQVAGLLPKDLVAVGRQDIADELWILLGRKVRPKTVGEQLRELRAEQEADLDEIEEELDRRLREVRRDPEQLVETVQALRAIQDRGDKSD
jgi:transcriptional regulator with XRE-family HTH domain